MAIFLRVFSSTKESNETTLMFVYSGDSLYVKTNEDETSIKHNFSVVFYAKVHKEKLLCFAYTAIENTAAIPT